MLQAKEILALENTSVDQFWSEEEDNNDVDSELINKYNNNYIQLIEIISFKYL